MMSEHGRDAYISIDVKNSSIHILQQTFIQLGSPKIIQLLFDPDAQIIGIRFLAHEVPGEQSLHVRTRHDRHGYRSYLYSKALITKMRKANSHMEQDGTYRLQGLFSQDNKSIIFPMDTMKLIEKAEEA